MFVIPDPSPLNDPAVTAFVTDNEVSVPTEVRLDPVTPEARVVPVRLAAATLPADPVTDPEIGLVTVRLVSVPTEVRLDPVTVDCIVVPASVSALMLPHVTSKSVLLFFTNDCPEVPPDGIPD